MGFSHDSASWTCNRCFSVLPWSGGFSDEQRIEQHERICATKAQRDTGKRKGAELAAASKKAHDDAAKLANPDFGSW